MGIRLSVHGGFIEWEAERELPASLLPLIRDHKPELIQILRGDRCRWCGERLAWPGPVGVVEGTGTALHLECYEPAEVARLLAAGRRAVDPTLTADPAEVTLRGEADS